MMPKTYWPTLNPRVTEEAGTRGGTHSGIDLAAERGDPVLAQFAGQIVYVGGDGARDPIPFNGGWLYPNGEGKTVDNRRDDGSPTDGLIQRCGHLEDYAVASGEWVAPGQVIGYAGDSGYSTGVHVHLENRWDRAWVGGNWINPRSLNPIPFTPQEEDDMYEQADRDRAIAIEKTAAANGRKLDKALEHLGILRNESKATYDALFSTKATSRGSSAGVLAVLGKIEGPIRATYDAQFKTTKTSRGTPGGTLVNDRIMLAYLDVLAKRAGISREELVAALEAVTPSGEKLE